MLRNMHNKTFQKRVFFILSVVIIPAFVLSGVYLASTRRQEIIIGKLGGRKITASEFSEASAAIRTQLQSQFGKDFEQVEKLFDINALAYERIMLLDQAKKAKLRVSDREVQQGILQNPSFQRKGSFDQTTYEYVLRYGMNVQPRVFEERVRDNLALLKLYELKTKDVSVTDEDVKNEYTRQNEQVSVSHISASPFEYQKDLTVTEDELQAYYKENAETFKKPTTYNLDYITLDLEAKVVGISEVIKRKDGLEQAARQYEIPVNQTGWFSQEDPIPGIGFVKEVSALLPALEQGQTLAPVHMDKNYYILRLRERKDPHIPALEVIREEVKERLLEKKAKDIARAKLEEALKAINAAGPDTDFNAVAQKLGLKAATTDLFKAGSYIQGIGASDIFFNEARKLQDKQISGILEMPTGLYIIRRQSLVPIDEKKFETEKAAFRDKLLNQKKQQAFTTYTEELKKKAAGK